jgi:uncharacterized protein with von Willebrand factor type A (vWA) domain
MKETSSGENLDKDVKEFEKWKDEYVENERKELEKDLEKADQLKPPYYKETIKNSM